MASDGRQPATLLEEATPQERGAEPSHVLAVGASGMLAGAVRTLARAGRRVSVVARNRERQEELASEHANIYPLVCDYTDEAGYEAALTVAFAERGAPTLAIVWMHASAPEGPQHTAQVISRSLASEDGDRPAGTSESGLSGPRSPGWGRGRGGRCRFFHLHGSASGSPDAAVEHYRRACSLLSHIVYRAVILGRNEQSGEWLSDRDISNGVLEAIQADRAIYWVGVR